jgi:SHS2 domain-containing protein
MLESVSAPLGHRVERLERTYVIDAWGPRRAACVTEALAGLVESFAVVQDAAVTTPMPLSATGGAQDALASLFEEVIDAIDVFGIVPVRFHLDELEGGGIGGDMEVVGIDGAEVVGRLPGAVSYKDLSLSPAQGGWQCHVLVDLADD